MNTILILCFAAVALGAPQGLFDDIQVVDQRFDAAVGPLYSFLYRLSNGAEFAEEGTEGANGAGDKTGYFVIPLEDGSTARIDFVADQFGFQPNSPILPVAPEVPPHAQAQLDRAAELRSQPGHVDDNGLWEFGKYE